MPKLTIDGKSVEDVRNASIAKIPLRRLGTTEDFGAAGAFLLRSLRAPEPGTPAATGTATPFEGTAP